MSKFKVGDQVQILVDEEGAPEGEIVTVTDVAGYGAYEQFYYTYNGIPDYISSSENAQLVAEPPTWDQPDGDVVELVNHPKHYNSHPSGVECITIVRHHNFNVGNAMKYLWRAGLKGEGTELTDLRKALFYVQDEIERVEGLTASE